MDWFFNAYNECMNDEELLVRPIRRVSSAYYPGFYNVPPTTIFAWVAGHLPEYHPVCTYGGTESVMLTLGRIDDNTLPEPFFDETLKNIRSQVSPGLACHLFSGIDYYSCMMAYVPPGEDGDPENNKGYIEILAFTPSGPVAGELRQGLIINQNTPVRLPLRTSSDIALWYTADKWWMAIQTMEVGQNTNIYYSPAYDGINWTYHSTLGFTVGGPSVAVDDSGNARIVFAR